jgi:hypothetical protein
MTRYRVVALADSLAREVRSELRSPEYGHPAHVEIAKGHGPCRSCLRDFEIGVDRRILFTHDAFAGIEERPLPGPVFIHENACTRHPEEDGFPADLEKHPLTLFGYARGRKLVTEAEAAPGAAARVLETLLARPEVDYVQVHDARAGCFDLRVERVTG